ncbi:MAG: type II toxin-antitoxin system HicB family antitoxin [Armatimonadetes bacterium]|nr:type II toxin-antitoxin system HicB family antitoxin [Armatimonadota bacterium]
MKEYLVIYEQGETSWGAYVPDLPGCVAVGKNRQEVERLIREAIELHVDGIRADGEPIPEPRTFADRISISA